MEQVKKALQELAADNSVPEVTDADVTEFNETFQKLTANRSAELSGLSLGPHAICLIKCAIQFGICKATKKSGCNTAFAQCSAECYLGSGGSAQ